MRIAVCLPAAVFMAILLSEVKNKVFKSLVQTVTYIPHFLSWVVVSVFCITFFNPETGINFLLKRRGLSPITLTDNNLFRIIVVGADMWKDMGFNSVLFLSAILSIDPGLYESAAIDGAGQGPLHLFHYAALHPKYHPYGVRAVGGHHHRRGLRSNFQHV